MKRKVRILVADDHPVVRAGVRQLLAGQLDAEITEAESATQAFELARSHAFDLLVLDIEMPSRSGLSILNDLRLFRPELPILVLSMHGEKQFAVRALRSGASGYIMKSTVSTELVNAVNCVLNGGRYVSAQLAQYLASAVLDGTRADRSEELSLREFEVLRLIARGKNGKEIASELSLSFKTVSTYRIRLLEKLKLQTTADLVRYAVEHQLLADPSTAV